MSETFQPLNRKVNLMMGALVLFFICLCLLYNKVDLQQRRIDYNTQALILLRDQTIVNTDSFLANHGKTRTLINKQFSKERVYIDSLFRSTH